MAQAPVTTLVIVGLILSFEFLVFFDTETAADNIVQAGPFRDVTPGAELVGSEAEGDVEGEDGGSFGTIINWLGTGLVCASAGIGIASGFGTAFGIIAGGACGSLLLANVFGDGASAFVVKTVKAITTGILGIPAFISLMVSLLTLDIQGAPVYVRFAFSLPINGAILFSVFSLVRGS